MENDSQATSIEQIKQKIESEKRQEMVMQQQPVNTPQQVPQQVIQQPVQQPVQQHIQEVIQEKEESGEPDMVKLGFVALILFLVLSTSQIEDILHTLFGDEQKSMMPFIKIALSIAVTYFAKKYIE